MVGIVVGIEEFKFLLIHVAVVDSTVSGIISDIVSTELLPVEAKESILSDTCSEVIRNFLTVFLDFIPAEITVNAGSFSVPCRTCSF